MTTDQITTETTDEAVAATSLRDRLKPARTAAGAALVVGFGISTGVAFAMNHSRAHYARYFGFVVVVALLAVVVTAYRTHVSPGREPAVEETVADEKQEAA